MRNRLHSLCPYFAMFPEDFVVDQLHKYSEPDDVVFDPFSGRGTTILQSLLANRRAVGIDINPVAYCISRAKAEVPTLATILDELASLQKKYQGSDSLGLERDRQSLPRFFRRAFYHTTLRELLFLRRVLKWRQSAVHCFITALALGSLHGEMGKRFEYFSNQMPRTISTKPSYSLRYWRRNRMWPKKRNVFSILRRRAAYRLSGEIPSRHGRVAMTDARQSYEAFPDLAGAIKTVITSPPYFNVTDYGEDQWLRLWFMGYSAVPTRYSMSKDDRHRDKSHYWQFLREVWTGVARLLDRGSVLVCRLGAKGISEGELTEGLVTSLISAFSRLEILEEPVISKIRRRQTDYFRPGSKGCLFEVDYVFKVW